MPKVGSAVDRIVVSLIALVQLGVSALLLFLSVAYSGFVLSRTPYFLFGLVDSFFLFTPWLVPRIGAVLWQSILVANVIIFFFNHPAARSHPNNQFAFPLCALMLIFLIYLAASIRQEFATRGWTWSAC